MLLDQCNARRRDNEEVKGMMKRSGEAVMKNCIGKICTQIGRVKKVIEEEEEIEEEKKHE